MRTCACTLGLVFDEIGVGRDRGKYGDDVEVGIVEIEQRVAECAEITFRTRYSSHATSIPRDATMISLPL